LLEILIECKRLPETTERLLEITERLIEIAGDDKIIIVGEGTCAVPSRKIF